MEIVKKLNRILEKPIKVKLFILLAAIIISGLIETGVLAVIYLFISLVLDNSVVFTNVYISRIYDFFNFSSVTAFLGFLSLSLAAIYILRSIYVFTLRRVSVRFIARLQASYSKRLLKKILGFSYLYHTHKNIAVIQRIISGDVVEMFSMISDLLAFLTDFFMAFFMLAYLFYESPVMTSCILGLTLICVVLYFLLFRDTIRKAGDKNRNAKIEMSKAVYQLFGGIKEVKVSRREGYFEKVFVKARDRQVKASVTFNVVSLFPKLSLEIVCYGGAFTLLGFFIFGGANISSFVPQLGLFVLAALRILPAMTAQISKISAVLYHKPVVDAVYRNLFEEKDIAAEVTHVELSDADIQSTAADIRIENVSFAYPGIDESVLEGVSFTIPENKSVALVGPSGVGKTTLADLVLGVLTPRTGTVLYKGRPVYDNDEWCSSVGYIPQHIYLLDESVLANVAFGIDKKDIDEEKAWRALEQAQLKAFVESLPDGINTIIGDRGIRLSGGQRQRVGIARAIYEDPPVLVLDEATSSLDTETEKAVMDAIKGFHGNKTILIIAHRLSTIEHCDIIYRVEDKTVTRER